MKPQDYFKVTNNKNDGLSMFYGNPKKIPDESRLSEITLEDLGFTVQSVKDQLLGMDDDLVNPATGEPYDDSIYKNVILRAVATTEKELNIVIRPRVNNERLNFNNTEYQSFMYLRTAEKPILQVDRLLIQFNGQPVMEFPDELIKVNNLFGQINVQPTILMQSSMSNLPSSMVVGNYPQAGMLGVGGVVNPNWVPQMIGVRYIAGMIPQPPTDEGINRFWYPHPDLISYVAKMATVEILERWGRTIIGAGIAGYDIAIDGISSSVNSTQSAENTGSTADIMLLQNDMKDIKNGLRAYYGDNFGVLS